jgi:NitT/TauT family transport system substrate-binding protein
MRLSTMAMICALTAPAAAQDMRVHVGTVGATSDVALFIADKKGYFRDEGLQVDIAKFDSAARMIAPLGSGQIDVGGGAPSAGLYNGVARGIDIRIVADKGSSLPGFGFAPLMIRKDLVESGRYKTLSDLKGMKLAIQAPGSGAAPLLNEAAKKGGLKWTDFDKAYMPYAQQFAAMANKALDGGIVTEPVSTEAERKGIAVRVMGSDEIYPNQEVAAILFAGQFARSRPEVAKKFMRAYIRGARFYNDAVGPGGKLTGPLGDEVVAVLVESTAIKDPAVHRSIALTGINPDGRNNIDSLRADLEFFREIGDVDANLKIRIEDVVDNSFAEAAVKELGPYKKKM